MLLTGSPTLCCRTNWTHWIWHLRFKLWTWTEIYSLHQTDLAFFITSWLVRSSCIDLTRLMFFGSIGMPWFDIWMFILLLLMVPWNSLNSHLFFSGQPMAYSEFFSLNRTTAEMRVLKPISRDLYQRFTLIIKASNDKQCGWIVALSEYVLAVFCQRLQDDKIYCVMFNWSSTLQKTSKTKVDHKTVTNYS